MASSHRPDGDVPILTPAERQAELAVRLLEGATPIATRLLESVDKDTEMRAEAARQQVELAKANLVHAEAESIRRHGVRVRAQWFALAIALTGFGLSGYAFFLGHPPAAAVVAGTSRVGIVTAMLKSPWHRGNGI